MKNKIYEEGIQWCKNCKDYTNHIPKMDAVKNGQRVCDECRCCNYYLEYVPYANAKNRCDECGAFLNEDKTCYNCHENGN